MKSVDLGCSNNKKEGAIGVDIKPGPCVDVVHDLNVIPWPFPDDGFDWVEMSNILEHVDKPLDVMLEVKRIAKPGATVRIITPHYTSMYSYGDLTHQYHFGYDSFRWLRDTGHFKLVQMKLKFRDIFKILGISLFANLFPKHWERYWCFTFPATFIEAWMEVVKDGPARE